MEIRPVRSEDNEQLIQLSRSAPMIGDVAVCIERAPDYFAFYNQYGPSHFDIQVPEIDPSNDVGWIAVCATQGNRIVGVVALFSKIVRYEGKLLRAILPGDARVAPDFQHTGVAKKMGYFVKESWGSEQADLILGYIIHGNYRAEKGFQEGHADVVTGVHAGDFHMAQLSMYRPYRYEKINVERATEQDIPEIVTLLADFYADYHFSPVFSLDNWKSCMSRSLGYAVEDIRIVRENGKIQAMIGLWDQQQVRKVVATKFPPRIKWGIYMAWAIRLFFNAPRPPRLNVPQTSLYIKHIAHRPGKLDLLAAMMRNVTNDVRISSQYNYIWGAFYDTDPLFTIFDGMQITDIRSGQYYSPWNTGWFKTPYEIESRPCYADFSMV